MIRIFIVTDLEGISGIETEAQVLNTQSEDYRYSRERLMADTNAAIAGAFDGGAGISDIGKNRLYKPIMPLEIKIVYNRTDYCEAALEKCSDVERPDARTLRRMVHKITAYSDVMI